MSTPVNPTPASAPPQPPTSLRLISHTGLVYWWPVWVVGFLLAGLTYWEDTRLAVLPAGSTVEKTDASKSYKVTVTNGSTPTLAEAALNTDKGMEPFPVRIAWRKGFGIVYFAVVFLVLFGSNIPLRGLASLLVVLTLVLVVILLSLLDWWTPILEFLGGLHIQISLAGYLIPSFVLLVMWLGTVFVYDQMRCVIFSQGQISFFQDIGTKVQTYDTNRVSVEKLPSDLLRHWVLGFGAGDLVVSIANQNVQVVVPNVLFAERSMRQIATLIATRQMVSEQN